MPRKGRFLEILVKHLEQFLAPEGFTIRSPEEFYRDGIKIGEIDVTVRGDFGLSRVFVGLECRDRPSDGPQGRDWIREVMGKKEDLQVDKLVAVSSTGFTPPAEDLAERFGIDLITVENVNEFNPSGWFETITFSSTNALVTIDGKPRLATAPPIPRPLQITPHTRFLRIPDSAELISLQEFLEPEVSGLSSVFARDKDAVEIKDTIRTDRPVYAVVDGKEFEVTELAIPVKLRRKVINAKALLNVFRRSCDDDIVALSGVCEFETNKRRVKALIYAKKNMQDSVLIGGEVTIHFLNEDNEPDEMIDLVSIDFYSQGRLVSSREFKHDN